MNTLEWIVLGGRHRSGARAPRDVRPDPSASGAPAGAVRPGVSARGGGSGHGRRREASERDRERAERARDPDRLHPQPVIATWTSGARPRRGSSAIRATRLALPRRWSFARSRSVATRTKTTTSGSPHSSRSTTPTWRTAIGTVTRCSRTSTAARAPRTSARRCSTSAACSRTSSSCGHVPPRSSRSSARLASRRRTSAFTSAPNRSAALVSHSHTSVTTTAESAPQLLLYEPKLAV